MIEIPATDAHGPRDDLADLTFGEQVRRRREETGLSQDQIGELAGVSRGTVRNAELGKPLGVGTRATLERALGWSSRRDKVDDLPPGQLLSATVVRGIGEAITDPRLVPDENRRGLLVDDWLALVASLEPEPSMLPPTFERLVDRLREIVRPVDLVRLLDDLERAGIPRGELDQRAAPAAGEGAPGLGPQDIASAATYVERLVADQQAHMRALVRAGAPGQVHPIVTRAIYGAVSSIEAFLIARSGLEIPLQDGLAQYATQRRQRFEAELTSELTALIHRFGGQVDIPRQ